MMHGQTQIKNKRYPIIVPGAKRPRRESDFSHPYSAEVRNEWKCPSTPPYSLMTCTSTSLPYIIAEVLVSSLLKSQHENYIVSYIIKFSMDYPPIDSPLQIVALQDLFGGCTSVNSKPG